MGYLIATDDLRSQGNPTNYEVCHIHNFFYTKQILPGVQESP